MDGVTALNAIREEKLFVGVKPLNDFIYYNFNNVY